MDNQIILLKAMRGDSQAFEQLVTPYEQMVWRVCWQMMGNQFDAEDTAQATMIRAWKSLSQYRGEAAFSTWLYRIAVHCCMDALRKRSRDRLDLMDQLPEDARTDSKTPEAELLAEEGTTEIREALNQLSEEQKVPLVLYAIEEKSYDEISETLGVPSGTVKSRIARGRERLRRLLSGGSHGKEALSV